MTNDAIKYSISLHCVVTSQKQAKSSPCIHFCLAHRIKILLCSVYLKLLQPAAWTVAKVRQIAKKFERCKATSKHMKNGISLIQGSVSQL